MVQKSIENALKNFGLTEKELEIYLFLSKRGAQKTGQIAKHFKKNKGLTYRLLKTLQKKGIVEATLESPIRYTAIPFEKIIDSYIKSKREEAEKIEDSKQSLLCDWDKISQEEIDSSLEKFGVIEGKKKILKKVSDLIKETKNQLSIVVTVSELCSMEQYGILEQLNTHLEKSKINCQFLTQICRSNLKAIKILNTKVSSKINLRGISSTLGKPNFSRMIIRDCEELLLFISDEKQSYSKNSDETTLFTNSHAIIQSFSGVFEELWYNSIAIESIIEDLEKGKPIARTQLIKNPLSARDFYNKIFQSAETDVQIVTSLKGIVKYKQNKSIFEVLSNNGIKIKLMVPIVTENLSNVQELMDFCEIKHIPLGYFETVIIDGKHLFQFKEDYPEDEDKFGSNFFKNTFYTNDLDYISRTQKLLYDLWEKTRNPSFNPLTPKVISDSTNLTHRSLRRIWKNKKLKLDFRPKIFVTEKDVLKKYTEMKNASKNTPEKLRFLGTRAYAIIHPPEHFQLPEMLIGVLQEDEASSFGAENILKIFLRKNNSIDSPFELVTHIQNSQKSASYRKSKLSGFPGFRDVTFVKENQLIIRAYGNTLFAGWTVPIQLEPYNYVLPPSCILFEGYGMVHPGIFDLSFPNGKRIKVWYNNLDAFVTFFHQSSKYIGSGTEGMIDRNSVQIPY